MNKKKEFGILALMAGVFATFYFLPLGWPRFDGAVQEALALTKWFAQSWDNAKQIFPLLIGGVLVAGLMLGRSGHEGLIPNEWIACSVSSAQLAKACKLGECK